MFKLLFFFSATTCVANRIEIPSAADKAKEDGKDIVGVVSSGSCDKAMHTLQISHTKRLVNQVSLQFTKSEQENWEVCCSFCTFKF